MFCHRLGGRKCMGNAQTDCHDFRTVHRCTQLLFPEQLVAMPMPLSTLQLSWVLSQHDVACNDP